MSDDLSPITAWRLHEARTFERLFRTPAGGMALLFIEDAIEGRGSLVVVVFE